MVLAIAAGACRQAAGEAPPSGHPALLFVCGAEGSDCQLHTWDDWTSSGFEVAVLPVARAASPQVLQRFNAVVIDFLPSVDAQRHVSPAQEAFEKSLRDYLEGGGGVVVFAGGGEWGWMTPALNHLLKPYGARVPDEQVVDPSHIVVQVGMGSEKLRVAMTQSITPAPMTRGITRLGYLSQTWRADAIKLTQPVVLEPGSPWQTIVRAGPTAWAAIARTERGGVELRRVTERGGEPPILAAARTVGKGRLFLFPHNVVATVGSPEVLENYLWNPRDRSEKGVPQNRSFIMQVVRWAAEPSLRSGAFGGYRTDPALRPERKFVLPGGRFIDWSKAPTGASLAPPLGNLRGVIGAQSAFSGGAHSIAELSAAARSAGLGFLAFTERLDRIDAAKWEEIKSECAQQSSDRFLAIPGIEAQDQAGNRYVALGWGPYPGPPSVTPAGDRIQDLYRFWATDFGTRFVAAVDVGHNPNPWFELKQISAFAVRTTSGSESDDSTAAFLASAYDMENYAPISFTVVSSAEEVRAAARGLVNVFTGRSLGGLRDYVKGTGGFSGRYMFWEVPHPWYVTAGPRLIYDGGIRLGALGVDEEAQNTFRYGFRLDGLERGDRIFLMDGPTTYREWVSDGSAFTTEHTWPHDQVRVLTIRVVRAGRTLLLSSPVTLQWGRRFNQSGDRQNTIPYNYEPDSSGDWYVATQRPLSPKYKAWPPETAIACNPKAKGGAVGIEYHVYRQVGWQNAPVIPLAGSGQEKEGSLASYQHQRLSCPGIVIVDEITSRRYPSGRAHPPDSAPPERTEPLRDFRLVQRRYGLYGAIGQLNGQLVESRLEALEDLTLSGRQPLVSVSRFNLRPRPDFTIRISTGGKAEDYGLASGKTVALREPLSAGDFMGLLPTEEKDGGAQIAVSGPLVARLHLGPGAGFLGDFALSVPSQWKAGQSFPYSILYTAGGCGPGQRKWAYRTIARFLGFGGAFSAISHLEGGHLLPGPGIATIETKPDAVVRLATRFEPDAPMGLPVRIRGYNPNWQVAYRLDGSSHWRYMGELDGDFYFHLYTQQRAHTVLAGQPLLADQPDLHITLDDPLGRQGAFELYNPTDRPMRARLRTNPAFFPEETFDVAVPPHASRPLRVAPAGNAP